MDTDNQNNEGSSQQGGGSISSSGDWGTTIDLGSDISKMSENQIDFEIAELTKKGSPYYEKFHPHSKRIKDRVERLYQQKYREQDKGLEGLSDGDRKLLMVLRGRDEQGEPKISDDELTKMVESGDEIREDFFSDKEITKGIRSLEQTFGKKETPNIVSAAQTLLKGMKVSDKDMEFLAKSGLSNDPDFITLLGLIGAKLQEARSRTGQTKESKKPKTKKEILEEANRLLKGETE